MVKCWGWEDGYFADTMNLIVQDTLKSTVVFYFLKECYKYAGKNGVNVPLKIVWDGLRGCWCLFNWKSLYFRINFVDAINTLSFPHCWIADADIFFFENKDVVKNIKNPYENYYCPDG